MSADDCPERDRAAGWALGLLAGPEADRFARHLEGCAGCRREVAGLEGAAHAMGAAPRRVPPAPGLRGRVAGPVRAEAELFRAAEPSADP